MSIKKPNQVWNQMTFEERTTALDGVYLSEWDKDYRTSPPEACFLRFNWQQVPAYVKDSLRRKWKFKKAVQS